MPPLSPDDLVAALRAAGCVYAEDEAALLRDAADGGRDLAEMLARRVAGEPLEWVVGWAAFGDLRLSVLPGVFVPRQQTALLADEASAHLPASGIAVDLCCGTGAVGFLLQEFLPGATVYAVDIDPVAATCARANVEALRADGVPDLIVLEGDLFDPLPDELRGRVDVITANTPYVPSGEIRLLAPEARLHEPMHTLDGGSDGLDILRRVADRAPEWLVPGGHLVIEIADAQADAAVAAFESAGLAAEWTRVVDAEDDYVGTYITGRAPRGRRRT